MDKNHINNSFIKISSCLWPEKSHRCSTVLTLQRTFSSLSLVGCILIIFVIWLFQTYKYFIQRLILFLTVSAAFHSFSFILSNLSTSNIMCQFQAFIMQYFGWATLLWVACITLNIILVLRRFSNVQRLERWYHGICWLGAGVWASLPFIGNKYGPAGSWCWIKRDATGLRFGTWYIPTFIVFLFLLVAYIYIITTVLQRSGRWSGIYNAETEHNNSMLAKDIKPLAAFPLIFLILSIPTLLYRIDDAVHSNKSPNYTLLLLSVIFAPSSGALNAIAFALYGEIQSLLTWSKIKSAFMLRFSSSTTVTHNFEVSENLPDNEILNEDTNATA